MAGQRPLEVITPPNMLKVKVGGRVGVNMAAIERAEAALRSMAGEFDQWIKTEVASLEAARDAVREGGLTGEPRAKLYRGAHDLKGMGGTYGYPIVGRLASVLCKLLECEALTGKDAQRLAEAHVDAISAAVREEIKDGDHPVTQAITTELESRVEAMIAAAG